MVLSPNQVNGPVLAQQVISLAGILSNITFAIQNCNSMNISTCCPKQLKKVKALIDLDADVLYLSDVRLNNNAGAVSDLKKAFLGAGKKQYNMIGNSTKNSRGVLILINTKIDYTINHEFRDDKENILCINLSIGGQAVNLGSIYGPNVDDPDFFRRLRNFLTLFNDCPTILGGDWNATYSTSPTVDNIDIFRMAAPPSTNRSLGIAELCDDFGLMDPFRALHPDLRDFTFKPRADRANRSRLDFFLVSYSILNDISSCKINPSISTVLFDHKSVFLTLNKPNLKPDISINQSILSHPRLPDVILGAVADCYLQHAVPDPAYNLDRGKLEVGTFLNNIRELNDAELSLALNPNDYELAARVRLLHDSLNMRRDLMPDPEQLNMLILSCESDTFLDVLVNNIKNSIVSFQAWSRKALNIKKNTLIARLKNLKADYLANSVEIFETEFILNNLVEEELKKKIQSMKLFEGLNSEKPSAIFLSLAKKRNTGTLSNIKNPDNTGFADENARNEFIVGFYENLYKKPVGEIASHTGVIDRFLGDEILTHPVVVNSKLTPDEHDELELPLTIGELDKAVKEGNKKSAPGADGLSSATILLCWKYLRHPLFNYANKCLEKGILTDNFRGASIRLIPKKNDLSVLKNWRPISLLSNLYKILSRALNSRLSKYVNRITSRSQKGFNNRRYTQEAIINVWEAIAFCKAKKIRAAVMAVDMEKAFDTISLGFLEEVYKFFGIGPNMIKWLKLIGNERFANIILDNGNLSRRFKLGRGRPQGDIISPVTFNFCVQILIFKLELDNSIKKIPRVIPDTENVTHTFFSFESKRETSKNESMADDNTTLTLLELESLAAVKRILADFELISGLRCNVDKTILMPVLDPTQQETDMVAGLGFELSDNFTLLGVKISNKLDNIPAIFMDIKNKIINLIAFWERFRLSLPGRLTIAKTYLISQLCYLGSFLPVPEDIRGEIQNLIDRFVKKNLRVSQERLYLPPSEGGLGAINLDTFLTAQCCTWVQRAFKYCIDNWRYDLKSSCPGGNIAVLRSSFLDQTTSPILFHMASCYEKFYASYCSVDNNFMTAYVYNNKFFARNRITTETIDKDFFPREWFQGNSQLVMNLKLSDFFVNGRMVSRDRLAAGGLDLPAATWLSLQAAASLVWNRRRDPNIPEEKCRPIEEFLTNLKKGSKQYKKYLEISSIRQSEPANLGSVRYFAELTDTEVPDPTILKPCLGLWNTFAIENAHREFLFKQRYNQLLTNNRLNAFDPDVDPRCTFCKIRDNNCTTRDSFEHFFLLCPTTQRLVSAMVRNFEPVPDMQGNDFKSFYWYGTYDDNPLWSSSILLVFDCFRYILWKYKHMRKIPNWVMIERQLKFILRNIFTLNIRIRSRAESANLLANILPAMG